MPLIVERGAGSHGVPLLAYNVTQRPTGHGDLIVRIVIVCIWRKARKVECTNLRAALEMRRHVSHTRRDRFHRRRCCRCLPTAGFNRLLLLPIGRRRLRPVHFTLRRSVTLDSGRRLVLLRLRFRLLTGPPQRLEQLRRAHRLILRQNKADVTSHGIENLRKHH